VTDAPAPEEPGPPDADTATHLEAGEAEAGALPPEAADGAAEEGGAPAAKRERATEAPVPPERLTGAVEAILLASGDVLTLERIRDLLGLHSVVHVREALEAVGRRWTETGSAVELQELAGGVRAATRPEYAEYVRRLSRRQEGDRLRPALLETLSIVAYRQPTPRVEVERIRGVQCGEAIRGLLERRLIKVVGRSEQPGRPLLYGTTKRFLEVFGLRSLKDLPEKGELKRL
jgi:segregation and condensation protein B